MKMRKYESLQCAAQLQFSRMDARATFSRRFKAAHISHIVGIRIAVCRLKGLTDAQFVCVDVYLPPTSVHDLAIRNDVHKS